MRVRDMEPVNGVMMPKKIRVEMEGKRALEIENTDISFDTRNCGACGRA